MRDLECGDERRKRSISGVREGRREVSRIDGSRRINERRIVRSERRVGRDRVVSEVRHGEEMRVLRRSGRRRKSVVTESWRKRYSGIVLSFDWVRFGDDDSGRRRWWKTVSSSVVLGEIPLCGETEFDLRNRRFGKSWRRRNRINSFDRLDCSEFHNVAKFFVRSEFVEFGELCDERRWSNERSSRWTGDRRIIEFGSRSRGGSCRDLQDGRIVEQA